MGPCGQTLLGLVPGHPVTGRQNRGNPGTKVKGVAEMRVGWCLHPGRGRLNYDVFLEAVVVVLTCPMAGLRTSVWAYCP